MCIRDSSVVLDFDKEAIRQAVTERCSKFNVEAIDAHLTLSLIHI